MRIGIALWLHVTGVLAFVIGLAAEADSSGVGPVRLIVIGSLFAAVVLAAALRRRGAVVALMWLSAALAVQGLAISGLDGVAPYGLLAAGTLAVAGTLLRLELRELPYVPRTFGLQAREPG